MVLVGFGASSMEGVGDSAGGFFARAQRAANRPDSRWINCGIGGNTTNDMLMRAQAVAAHQATRLVVLLGCNDLPRAGDGNPQMRTTLQQYQKNLSHLLPAIRAPHSLFISSFAVSWPKTGISEGDFDRYMGAGLAAARACGYDIWDLYAEMKDTIAPYWAPDGVHLGDAGHQLVADGVVRWLDGSPT